MLHKRLAVKLFDILEFVLAKSSETNVSMRSWSFSLPRSFCLPSCLFVCCALSLFSPLFVRVCMCACPLSVSSQEEIGLQIGLRKRGTVFITWSYRLTMWYYTHRNNLERWRLQMISDKSTSKAPYLFLRTCLCLCSVIFGVCAIVQYHIVQSAIKTWIFNLGCLK